VLCEVPLHELGEREPPRDPSLPSKPLELTLERLTRVLFIVPTARNLDRGLAATVKHPGFRGGSTEKGVTPTPISAGVVDPRDRGGLDLPDY
jgi:hypothetical protein